MVEEKIRREEIAANMEKRSDKKGFTLVELIVVLVILAILAAIMVPALLGWIDKARNQDAILECRNVVQAVQAQVAEEYAKNDQGISKNIIQTTMNTADVKAIVLKIADLGGVIGNSSIILNNNFMVTNLKYKTEKGISVVYDQYDNPVYRIREKGKYSDDVPGYIDRVTDLDDKQTSSDHFLNGTSVKEEFKDFFQNYHEVNNNTSRRIQAAYIEEYDEFPKVDWERVPLPEGVKLQSGGAGAVWKPIVTADGEVILTADTKGTAGNSSAYVVYANGQYYYHRHSAEQPNTATAGTVHDITLSIDRDIINNPEWVAITEEKK